ncbi:MAG TPA: hypothetical protein VGM08_02545 [Candidatus Saccharimonadales bacterium]|jgi:hypothetical protein
MLDKKLQLKDGERVAIFGNAAALELQAKRSDIAGAGAVLNFVTSEADLMQALPTLQSAASSGRLTWVAYPKAKQLATDLNRNIIRKIANDNGLDPIRQIAVDEVWSALRLKAL